MTNINKCFNTKHQHPANTSVKPVYPKPTVLQKFYRKIPQKVGIAFNTSDHIPIRIQNNTSLHSPPHTPSKPGIAFNTFYNIAGTEIPQKTGIAFNTFATMFLTIYPNIIVTKIICRHHSFSPASYSIFTPILIFNLYPKSYSPLLSPALSPLPYHLSSYLFIHLSLFILA